MGNKISRKHDVKKSTTIWNCTHETRVVLNHYRLMGSYRNFDRLSSALRKHSLRQEKRRALFEPLGNRRLSKSTTALDERNPDTSDDKNEPSTLAKTNRRRSFSPSDLEDLARHVEEILQASEEFEDCGDPESGAETLSSKSDISSNIQVCTDGTDSTKLFWSTQSIDGHTNSPGTSNGGSTDSFNDPLYQNKDQTDPKSQFKDSFHTSNTLNKTPNKRLAINSAPASTDYNQTSLEMSQELNWLQRSGPACYPSLVGPCPGYNKPSIPQEFKDTATSTTDLANLVQTDQSPTTPTSDIPRLFHQQEEDEALEMLSVKCPVLRDMMNSGFCSPKPTTEQESSNPFFPSTDIYPDKSDLNTTEPKSTWYQPLDCPTTCHTDDCSTHVKYTESNRTTTSNDDASQTPNLKENQYQDAESSAGATQASPVIIKKLIVYNIQDVNKLHHGNTHLYQYHCYHNVGHLTAANTTHLEKASAVTKL